MGGLLILRCTNDFDKDDAKENAIVGVSRKVEIRAIERNSRKFDDEGNDIQRNC